MSETSNRDALPKDYSLHWYRIDSVLGQGGFGITYLAHDSNLDQLVAIKEYLPLEYATRVNEFTVAPRTNSHEEHYLWGLERFISEARTLAQFDHRNIVRVHSVFEFNATAYIVMRYERGESLATVLERQKTLDEATLMEILFPILDGLGTVHEAGFIHRDIKPANIYIREDGTPVLLDFGSARQSVGRSTLTVVIAPGYAPFEQYYSSGEQQGPWTDIYSLGATLYQGITGVVPIDAIERSKGVLGSTRDILVPAVLIGKGRYSPEFLEAVDHALEFKESDRPQSIGEWLKYFSHESLSEPTPETTPPDIRARVRKQTETENTPTQPGDFSPHEEMSLAPPAGVPATRTEGGRTLGWRWAAAIAVGVVLAVLLLTLYGGNTETGLLDQNRAERGENPPQVETSAVEDKSGLAKERASIEAGLMETQSQQREILAKLQALEVEQRRAEEAELEDAQPDIAFSKAEFERMWSQQQEILSKLQELEAEQQLKADELKQKEDAEEARRQAEAEAKQAQEETARIEREAEISELLMAVEKDVAALRLSTPVGNNALEKYRKVLSLEPDNSEAQRGLVNIVERYLKLADEASAVGELDKANSYLSKADRVLPGAQHIAVARRALEEARKESERLAKRDEQLPSKPETEQVPPIDTEEPDIEESQTASISEPLDLTVTILPFTSIDPSSYNHTDVVEDIREGVVNAIYSYDVLRISGDYHLEKFAPEALSLSSIWSDGFGQKEPVLDIILKYARNWDHNIVILGQLKRDWRNLTLYVIDVRTGSVSEYHVQKGEVESVTRAALSKWLAEHRAGKTH